MSENYETQKLENAENMQQNQSQNVNPIKNSNETHENFMKGLADFVIERYNNKQTEAENRKKLIESNLAEYDKDNYSENKEFLNLYTEAINALGENLDTKKFIDLIDKYVNSRITSRAKAIQAKKENASLTDSLAYSAGASAQMQDNVRFQDLTPEELPKYIAKYI